MFNAHCKSFLNLTLISLLVASCAEASAAEAPIALAPVGVTINTNTPPPTPRVSPTLRPPTQPPTRTLVPTLRPTNTLAPIGRPPVRPAVQAVAPTLTFTAAPQVARSGTIREIEVESDVLSKLNSNAVESSASLGQKIVAGGTVRTLDRGKARIDLNEGTVVRVAPKTLFTVTDLNQDTLNPFTRLQLAFGKVFIILSGGRMEVETPVGSASVRGSFMSVEFNAALRQLTINCLETAFNCDLAYQGTIFNLITLQKMIVPPYPPTIQPMTGADIKDWLLNVPNSSNVIAPTNTPPPPGPAATATNTTVPNIVVNTLTDELNSDGDCSLREAIRAVNTNTQVDQCVPTSNNTITFSVNGTITLTLIGAGEDAGLTGDLDVLKSVTIIGNGTANTIIDGNTNDRIFAVLPATTSLSLSNMTLKSGNVAADKGGAILVNNGTTLTVNNAIIESNTATDGGGIYSGGTVSLTNTTIKNNTATANGGGINTLSGSLTISGGTIGGTGTGNTASLGGGIYTSNTTSITGTLIEDNTASGGGGGGIQTAGGTTTIQNTIIKKNKGFDAGGGIHVATGGTVTISKSAIDQNTLTSTGLGGGVYNENIFNAKETSITANTVSVSTTSYGGGLYNNAGTATLKNVTLSNNTASGSGGGIKVAGGTVKTNNVTIAYNSAPNGVGGGIHVDGTGTLEIGNTILSDNSALGVIECDLGGGTVTDKNHNLIHNSTTCGFSGANNLTGSSANLAALAGTTPAYHALNAGSPAIDKGDAFGSATQACESNDARGVARPFGSYCDIGAYEKN